MTEPKRTALIYDFDGTLAAGNLQEQSFIPDIGMSREAFWAEVKARAKEHDADEILVYMHLMLEKAAEAGITVSLDALRKHGERAQLFPALPTDHGSTVSTRMRRDSTWTWSTTSCPRGLTR